MPETRLSREMFDHKNKPRLSYVAGEGLSEEIIHKISDYKKEPEWMRQFRLNALKIFNSIPVPVWGPDITPLMNDFNKIKFFAIPDAEANVNTWDKLPDDIKKTFEKLGIPEAEKSYLGGVGLQYESQAVYHNLKKSLEEKGVIFTDCDIAIKEYPELFKQHFMTKCVPVGLHKFSALHAAVWSGGTFIYIPKNVKVDTPLQAYFRMNAESLGQFEHTLIIADEGSEIKYIEGCFTKGTKITTNPSYKPIEEISVGDKVLTHTGEYKKVSKVYDRPLYNGYLYNIIVGGDSTQSIKATEEHPFLTVKRKRARERNKTWIANWSGAGKLKELDYLLIPINRKVVSNDFMDFEVEFYRKKEIKNIKTDNDFFRLVGYYLAEGSINKKGNYLSFSFGVHEKEYIKDVKRILKRLGVKKIYTPIHKKNNGISLVVGDSKLARVFKQFGTSASKKSMPLWCLLEHPEKQKEIIIGLFRGDGNYYNKKLPSGTKEVIRLNTVSEKLARQTKDILFRLNIFSFLNKRDRRKENRQAIYTVGITGEYMFALGGLFGIKIRDKLNNKKRASMFYIDKKYAYAPIRKITKSKVKNLKVYNFAVEGNETYSVPVVVHNCSAPQYTSSSIHAGCVEIHVKKRATASYISVENWSKNTFNLNTKRAVVDEEGTINWINGNNGSRVTMLYPCSVLMGRKARSDFLGIAFAGKGQNQDTGTKVYHLAPETTSVTRSKSISKDGGISSYRGLLKIAKGAKNTKASVQCDALLIDEKSKSNTFPYMEVKEDDATVVHETTVGKISDDQIFYLRSRGLSEEQARKMIVAGFIEPIVKAMPLEYAVELNRLIELEMENAIG